MDSGLGLAQVPLYMEGTVHRDPAPSVLTPVGMETGACVAESLCCTAEINTLSSNFSSIKFKKKRGHGEAGTLMHGSRRGHVKVWG